MKKIQLFEASSITDLESKLNHFLSANRIELVDFKIDQFKINSNGMPERYGFVGTLIYNEK